MKKTITLVQKYGGSSVATTAQIYSICELISKLYKRKKRIVVVASAMGKTTNGLISLASELSTSPNKRDLDFLLSTGEMQTVSLLSICLNELGIKSVALTGFQAGIITNDKFSRAFITDIEIQKIKTYLDDNYIVFVAGFQGITDSGEITTLGRGGSDTTAVAIASALSCPCEIYTDVEAVHTIDPKLFGLSKKLHKISYDEMMEMAVNGAKVLEPRSVELAKKNNVKLYLGKTLETNKQKGTYIMKRPRNFEDMPIKSLIAKDDILVLNVESEKTDFNAISKVFTIISNHDLNLELISQIITQDKNIFSFSLLYLNEATSIIEILKKDAAFKDSNIYFTENLVKISIVGIGLATHTNISERIFSTLSREKIVVGHIAVSEIAISFTIKKEDKTKTIQSLASEFNL